MKYIYNVILTIFLLPMVTYATIGSNSSLQDINVYLFTNECDKCNEEEKWLKEIYNKYARLNNNIIDINDNNEKYYDVIKKLNIKEDKYPLLIIGTNYYIGFNDKIKEEITNTIENYSNFDSYCDIMNTKLNIKECQKQNNKINKRDNYFPYFFATLGGVIILSIIFILLKKNKHNTNISKKKFK